MVERKHSGSYEVTDRPHFVEETGWCSTRLMVYVTALACFIVYLIGSIITGVTYRTRSLYLNCTTPADRFHPTLMYVFDSPMVVVGPCFMSAGGSILLYLLFQWFLCRPSLK